MAISIADARNAEIIVDGKSCYVEQAYYMLRQPIIDSDILTPHPDDSTAEQANRLLVKLANTDILSNKAKAIINYQHALESLLLHKE